MATFKVKNWSKHQHFKDRRPPWIKLYRDILDDIEWHELSGDDAKTLVMLWLIASENSGELPDIKALAFRLRTSTKAAESQLNRLCNWLISTRYQDDINLSQEKTATELNSSATDIETPLRDRDRDRDREENTPIPPKGAESAKVSEKQKTPAITLMTWLEAIKASAEKPIPENDPVFAYAEQVGIPPDHLRLCWREFRERYSQPGAKRYRDWRGVFRKAVRGNWFKLWWVDADGQYMLTTCGKQAEMAAKQ